MTPDEKEPKTHAEMCPHCGMVFENETLLQLHIREAHADE
jgi:uncharacterized C2H2 Zn-finger protein